MTASPHVAVIVAAYNAAATIEATIASILCQDYTDFSLVVVDDGSGDATAEVARRCVAGDGRCSVVTQPNGGPGSARNTGLAATSSELVCFVDADDCWDQGFLATLVDLVEHNPSAVGATGTFVAVTAHGEALEIGSYERWQHEPVHRRGLSLVRSERFDFEALATRLCVPPPAGVLVRRAPLLRTGGFDARATRSEDFELWCRLAHFGDFVHTTGATFRYRIDGDQRSKRRGRGAGVVLARLLILEKITSRAMLVRTGCSMAVFYLDLARTRFDGAIGQRNTKALGLGAANLAIALSLVVGTVVCLAIPHKVRLRRLFPHPS